MRAAPHAPAVVCFPFIGDRVGGSHVSALSLIRHLDPARFMPLIVVHRPEGPLASLLQKEGLPFEAAPVADHLELFAPHDWRAGVQVLSALPRLARFLRARRAALVHTNDGRMHLTWGLAARLAGSRLLWHHRSDPRAFGLRFVAPWAAHHVVAVSRFASPRSGRFLAARRSSVVHSPFDVPGLVAIDRAACRARLVAELGCPPETCFLGYFGTLVARKRPLAFVEIIAALKHLAPDLPVMGLLFGHAIENFDAAVAARAEALQVADAVRLMGFRYPGEAWLAACDLLLVPAIDEPFGRTLIEAMLVGTPVIATASGGNPEALRDDETGFLVPPEDIAGFARRSLQLLRDPALRQQISAAARADALDRFGIERHADAIMRIYAQLLGR